MWLERLPWPIPIESPPFVEPNEPVAVEFGRQVIFSAMEHVGRESRIIQQHSLVVANILDDDVGHRGSFVHETLATLDQRRAFFARQEVMNHDHLAWVQIFLSHVVAYETT